jgi:antitoxin component of MazEF toxin-antitoxin module
MQVKIQKGGMVVIPLDILKQHDLSKGDTLEIIVKNGEIRLSNWRQRLAAAQELIQHYIPDNISLVDELLKERRREVAKEEQEYQEMLKR